MVELPKIVAHRGFWTQGNAAENSLQALKQAQQLGVYGSEFDVHMCRDGVVVVYHDPVIDGLKISEVDFEELTKIRLENGERIPTLEEYLIQGKQKKSLRLILEIKNLDQHDLEIQTVDAVMELVNQLEMESQIEFISFSKNICNYLKREYKVHDVRYLNGDLNPEQIKELGLNGINYEYKVYQKFPFWVKEAGDLGLKTASWTVNDAQIFEEMNQLGIDFITTDFPDLFSKSL